MIVMKRYLIYLLVIMLTEISCTDHSELPGGFEASISVRQYGCDFIYAGLPARFQTDGNYYNYPQIQTQWNFGDGTISNGVFFDHTFLFPGRYRVTLSTQNPAFTTDTFIVVNPALRRIGTINRAENGKTIVEDPVSGYHIIHSASNGSSNDPWNFLSVSSSFDSLRSKELVLSTFPGAQDIITTSTGSILLLGESLWEFDKSGNMINKSRSYTANQIDVIETTEGYKTVGFNFVYTYNKSLEKISEAPMDMEREGYMTTDIAFESPDLLRVIYTHRSSSNAPQLLTRTNLQGDIISEIELSQDGRVSKSVTLSSGIVLKGKFVDEYSFEEGYIFKKINDQGLQEWSFTSSVSLLYPTLGIGQIDVYEVDDFTYIFFDVVRVMKISKNGELVWAKQFGTSYDTFNSAIRNRKGNFVIMASHQFDYETFTYTADYAKRDLSFIEIDLDGNIISK
jgi:hypothetical protein